LSRTNLVSLGITIFLEVLIHRYGMDMIGFRLGVLDLAFRSWLLGCSTSRFTGL
jgi:hypothetical protein